MPRQTSSNIEPSLDKRANNQLYIDQTAGPSDILQWFVRRWQVEVTFQEVRTYFGVETQRKSPDQAICRTTSILLGLFSLVTFSAKQSQVDDGLLVRQAAWYVKTKPTFSDAIDLVRKRIWNHWGFCMSGFAPKMQKSHATLLIPHIPHPSARVFGNYLGGGSWVKNVLFLP